MEEKKLEKLLLKKGECPFCMIANKKAPAYVIKETEKSIAFLDLRQINWGHVIIIPKRHVEKLTDLTEDEIQDLFLLVKEIDQKIRKANLDDFLKKEVRTGTLILIREDNERIIKHLAIHVIPRSTFDMVFIDWRPIYESMNPLDDAVLMKIKERLSVA